MTRFEKKAKTAVQSYLRSARDKPVLLFSVACAADEAARNAGKKTDLYRSLYDYPQLLPETWTVAWLSASPGTGDSLLFAVPRAWRPGKDTATSLNSITAPGLLGTGTLEYAH
jgi:hypothetical protein